jgi:hypothetical protein
MRDELATTIMTEIDDLTVKLDHIASSTADVVAKLATAIDRLPTAETAHTPSEIEASKQIAAGRVKISKQEDITAIKEAVKDGIKKAIDEGNLKYSSPRIIYKKARANNGITVAVGVLAWLFSYIGHDFIPQIIIFALPIIFVGVWYFIFKDNY